jgi:threonine dehydrogenase-like Zn-dependent dehydrogenase
MYRWGFNLACGAAADGRLVVGCIVAFQQDLEILKGYVPGYNHVLGHEFVGIVEATSSRPELVGQRVVGEINCPSDDDYRCLESSVPSLSNHGEFLAHMHS